MLTANAHHRSDMHRRRDGHLPEASAGAILMAETAVRIRQLGLPLPAVGFVKTVEHGPRTRTGGRVRGKPFTAKVEELIVRRTLWGRLQRQTVQGLCARCRRAHETGTSRLRFNRRAR